MMRKMGDKTPGLPLRIEALKDGQRGWCFQILEEHWGSAAIVTRGRLHDATTLPGFVAFLGERPVGLAIYRLEDQACELVSLNSLAPGQGIGSALVGAVRQAAEAAGCRRLWLITTNDNTPALRFYQRLGFVLSAVYLGAVDASRLIKPQIPARGLDGIPIRDEIELEMLLGPPGPSQAASNP